MTRVVNTDKGSFNLIPNTEESTLNAVCTENSNICYALPMSMMDESDEEIADFILFLWEW